MTLFKYLSHSSPTLNKKNILQFLDENNLVSSEKETEEFINRLFSRIGVQKQNKMIYT